MQICTGLWGEKEVKSLMDGIALSFLMVKKKGCVGNRDGKEGYPLLKNHQTAPILVQSHAPLERQ